MGRPRCITYNMTSVDGRLTIAPGVSLMAGDPRWDAATAGLGDPYDWVRQVHDPQVLLEGSGSFLSDGGESVGSDEGLSAGGDGRLSAGGDGGLSGGAHVRGRTEPETAHHLPPGIVDVPSRRWFAVVDGRGRVDLQFTEWPDPAWAGWHALVLTSRAAPAEHLMRLRERGIPYLVVGRSRVDLPAAMELLGSRLGVRTVVCTGGGRLGGAMLRAGLVDEIDLDVLPVAIGGRGTPALFDAAPLRADEWPTPLSLKSAETFADGRVRLRYVVRTGEHRPA